MTRTLLFAIAWLAVVVCILVAWHHFRRYGKAVDAAQEAAWEGHDGSALDLLCEGRNSNICVAEGCYGEACRSVGDEAEEWLRTQR